MSQTREITLPVPWGHVSAKVWGSSENFPVLCVHGIMDNAGAFYRLISLLPKHYYYIAIDLPGHGFSSHLPSGIQLNFFDYLLALRYIVNEFQWKNFVFVGHSLGGQLGTFYSLTYPNEIRKLILIEGLVPRTFSMDELIPQVKKIHDSTMRVQKPDVLKHHNYTREEITYALQFGRGSFLTKDAAEALFKRSVSQIGGLFRYNRDLRLKTFVAPLFNLDQMISILSQLKVHVLLILTESTLRLLSDQETLFLTKLPRHFKHSRVICINGNHDVHNNHPEKISSEISQFLHEVDVVSKL